jgi:hypothetical protein
MIKLSNCSTKSDKLQNRTTSEKYVSKERKKGQVEFDWGGFVRGFCQVIEFLEDFEMLIVVECIHEN